uniref:Uncharacterized protein n=1 Tax=Cacopsylla melanoneura TaxID=428564 RepID=A0A8D8RPE4_9HEMI
MTFLSRLRFEPALTGLYQPDALYNNRGTIQRMTHWVHKFICQLKVNLVCKWSEESTNGPRTTQENWGYCDFGPSLNLWSGPRRHEIKNLNANLFFYTIKKCC